MRSVCSARRQGIDNHVLEEPPTEQLDLQRASLNRCCSVKYDWKADDGRQLRSREPKLAEEEPQQLSRVKCSTPRRREDFQGLEDRLKGCSFWRVREGSFQRVELPSFERLLEKWKHKNLDPSGPFQVKRMFGCSQGPP